MRNVTKKFEQVFDAKKFFRRREERARKMT